jgi:hypothetical protein
MPWVARTVAIIAGLGALAGAGTLLASGGTDRGRQYVSNWAPAYRTFAKVYVKAYRPCLRGATNQCADAQELAAHAAIETASMLASSTPPKNLARDVAHLERDLRAAHRTLSASAAAARAGQTSARHWCSAEQGPCTVVMIDMGNVIDDINFVAKVDLPLPA